MSRARAARTLPLTVALALASTTCGDPGGGDRAPPSSSPAISAPPAASPSNPLAAPSAVIDPQDPATCEACHAAVVSEWRESLHARAHHDADPVYAALRKLRVEKQGAQIPAQCGACHNPADVADPESKAARLGVGCATCHQLDGVDLAGGKKGVHALVAGPHGRFRGPHDVAAGTSPAHANGPALPALVDGKTLCLACHAEEHNAAGIATCATGIEHAAASEAKPCTSCHMPELAGPSGAASTRDRHRSHEFRGPHLARRRGEPGIVAEAVGLSGRLEGERLVVTLENRSDHAFPTGFPGRMAVVVLRALGADGAEVGRNVTSDAMKEHPEAVLNQGFVGEDGKPALAAFATKKVRDTRLKPDEKRELTWTVPPRTDRVELRLRFFLVPPPMAKAIGHEGPESSPIELPPVVVKR